MFGDLDQKYRQWVFPLLKYDTVDNLVKGMEKTIIKPALLLADNSYGLRRKKERPVTSRISFS
jgi:hypothetical protein